MGRSFLSLGQAKSQIENEMAKLQRELVEILTGQHEAGRQQVLEAEIENRTLALRKLEAQTCCDRCGKQDPHPALLHIRITRYPSLATTLPVKKIGVRAECEDCCRPATTADIGDAIHTLQPSKWREVSEFADRRASRFPPSLDKSGDDLFQEALVRTWDGSKKWKKSAIDFPGHLRFAIRNIAHSWEETFYRAQSRFQADNVIYTFEGEEISLIENAPSREPSIEQRLIAREMIAKRLTSRRHSIRTRVKQAWAVC